MRKLIVVLPAAALSLLSLVLLGACSIPGASADPSTTADQLAATTETPSPGPSPTPTIVSNVPFPLDPAPTQRAPATNGASVAPQAPPQSSSGESNSAQAPQQNTSAQHRDGEHEGEDGHEGHEGGDFGERGTLQHVVVSVIGSGIQIGTPSVSSGSIEFDLTNETTVAVDIQITGNDVKGDTGLIAPGATVHLQGVLPPGSYTIALTPGSGQFETASVILQVQ